MSARDDAPRSPLRGPLASPEAVGNEPAPFPVQTGNGDVERCYLDWRLRLTRNLARRSDGRWEPLTRFDIAKA